LGLSILPHLPASGIFELSQMPSRIVNYSRNSIYLISACPVKCEAYFPGAATLTIAT